jgi:hypothetical protein
MQIRATVYYLHFSVKGYEGEKGSQGESGMKGSKV